MPAPAVVHRIEPGSAWWPLPLRDLWSYRELLWSLARRDLAVRYRQTLFGIGWALLQPLLLLGAFVAFFAPREAAVGGPPYALIVLCGLVPWQLFSYALVHSANSLVENERLIGKVYFPRLIIPLASLLPALVDLLVAGALLVAGMAWFGIAPGPRVLLLPAFAAIALVGSLATGLLLAALNAHFRDVRYVLPFLAQAWLLASPIAYALETVPARAQWWFLLNPMTAAAEGFRWCLLGGWPLPATAVAVSATASLLLLLLALHVFARCEATVADVL